MWTTLLNPTLWLLAALVATAVAGVSRRESAARSLERVVHGASRLPILAVLLLMGLAGISSRAVVAYRAPGMAAGHVPAMERFAAGLDSQPAGFQSGFSGWMPGPQLASPPWTPAPEAAGCPAAEMGQHVRLFTPQAHAPLLLLAENWLLRVVDLRTLNALLILLSLSGAVVIMVIALEAAGVHWKSRDGLLIIAAVAGWQPVLAGVREADVILPATALTVVAWHLYERSQFRAALAGSFSACLTPAAVGLWPALARGRRGTVVAGVLLAVAVTTTIGLAGPAILPDYVATWRYAATNYADVPTNYAVSGRFIAADLTRGVVVATLLLFAVGWWRCRSRDGAFSCFITLGVLSAPVVWSQHLGFLLVPALVSFRRVNRSRSSAALGAWALLMLLFSLPDPAVRVLANLGTVPILPGVALPPGAAGLVALWVWVLVGAPAVQHRTGPAPVPAVLTS